MSSKVKFISTIAPLIVALDQATKLVVDNELPLHTSIPVIQGFFSLTYIRNTGAAFGIFSGGGFPFRLPVLVLFSLVAIGFIVVMLRRLPEQESGLMTALSFILGGAIGNLIDRVLYGEVIDFLDFYWAGYHWPAFNFADSFITLGVALIILRLIRSKGEDPFAPAK